MLINANKITLKFKIIKKRHPVPIPPDRDPLKYHQFQIVLSPLFISALSFAVWL